MLSNLRSIHIKEFTAEADDAKVTNFRINAKVTFDLERWLCPPPDKERLSQAALVAAGRVSSCVEKHVSSRSEAFVEPSDREREQSNCPGNRGLLYFIDVNSGVVASSEGK